VVTGDISREQRLRLRDGTEVMVRPIAPGDKAKLVEGLHQLSPASSYRRFMRPVTSLSARELSYLTEVDYTDHFAWVALADESDSRGLGVARYVRDPKDPEVAEAAVAVIDDFHNRGLGTVLIALLVESALGNGIRVFRGWVLGDNVEVLRPLERIGARRTPEGGVLRVEVDLSDVFEGSTIQEALRAVAAGEFEPQPRS